jgi:hypothetical protein
LAPRADRIGEVTRNFLGDPHDPFPPTTPSHVPKQVRSGIAGIRALSPERVALSYFRLALGWLITAEVRHAASGSSESL